MDFVCQTGVILARHAGRGRTGSGVRPVAFSLVTGLIYAAIIALWAAVLIPMWLKRHEDSRISSVDRFSRAMGSLARRNANSGDTTVKRVSASTRRMRIVVGLTIALAFFVLTAALGILPKWTVLVPLVPLVAFLAARVLIAQSSQRQPLKRRTGREEQPTGRTVRVVAEQVAVVEPVALEEPARMGRHAGRPKHDDVPAYVPPMYRKDVAAMSPSAQAEVEVFASFDAAVDEERWQVVAAIVPVYVESERITTYADLADQGAEQLRRDHELEREQARAAAQAARDAARVARTSRTDKAV